MIDESRPKSPDPDIQGSYSAIQRAAKLVRERARINGTPLVYWRDGKVVLEYVPKDEPTSDNAQQVT
ncbi:MAG: hypothetical protein K8T91_20940 [Planctomycetes bacterium]|nr:hypothetical protein [Planctomycetota bacterium]